MGEESLALRERDRERLWVLKACVAGKVRTKEAAERLGMSRRQVERLVAGLRERGDGVVIHGLRGRPGNRAKAPRLKDRVLGLQARLYEDYGPTLLAERLAKPPHGIRVGRETLRRWMVAAGRWKVRRRRGHDHPWRERRARFGELVQLDTSIHDWFEGRGERAVLVAGIDDATGRAWGCFGPGDTVHANLGAIRGWVQRYGRPLAFYVDRHTHFSVADEAGVQRSDTTQIGRALGELGIEMISAHSPQAKGRVERLFRTLQDRLVKALRERGIGAVEEANAFLEGGYWEEFREAFARPARDEHDAHRPLLGEHRRRLAAIFSVREERKVATNMTIQFQRRLFLLETSSRVGLRVGDKVDVATDAVGGLRVLYGGRDVRHREVELDRRNKPRQPTLPLHAILAGVRPHRRPAKNHPWRRTGLFPNSGARSPQQARAGTGPR